MGVIAPFTSPVNFRFFGEGLQTPSPYLPILRRGVANPFSLGNAEDFLVGGITRKFAGLEAFNIDDVVRCVGTEDLIGIGGAGGGRIAAGSGWGGPKWRGRRIGGGPGVEIPVRVR